MLRLFIGIPIVPPAALAAALAEYRAAAAGVRWEAPEALHLTLKFIGAWPESRLPELVEALERVEAGLASGPALRLRLRGLGAFPSLARPHTLWAGVEPTATLLQQAAGIEQRLLRLGIGAETRPFTPHVTLARLRRGSDLGRLRGQLDPAQPAWGESRAAGFSLFQTVAGAPPASRYRIVQGFAGGRGGPGGD